MTSKQCASYFALAALTLVFSCGVAHATACPLPTNVGVVICTPDNEDTVASPVEISAAAKGNAQLRTWKIYIDGVAMWTSPQFVDSIDPSLNLAAGQHRVTVKVWDVNGTSYSKTVFITVKTGTTGCPATVDRTIVICQIHGPRGGRIDLLADAADRLPIFMMKVYIDGRAVCSETAEELAKDGNSISCASFGLAFGQTRITVKAWDALGAFSVTKTVF